MAKINVQPYVKPGLLWYAPGRIYHYTREEVAWIIREAWDGWPPQPSGYIDADLDVEDGPRGMPGQDALDVIAEIEVRLRSTREAGEALIGELQSPAMETADLWHYDRFKSYLSEPARRALNYVSGMRRRRLSYADWKADQARRKPAIAGRKSAA